MTRFKLVAADLDDTLLTSSLEISARTVKAIEGIRAAGVHFTLATGRMYRSALPYARQLQITEPLITYQGALVKDARSGEVIFYQPVPLNLAKTVLQKGYELGVHMNVYVNDALYVDSITEKGIGYANLAGVELNPVGNLVEFLKEDPVKILFIADPELLEQIQPDLEKQHSGELYITRSKPNYLEFMHPRANKGEALAAVAAAMGVSREDVVAFGDSFNDLTMIHFAGLGVAMGNAWPEVKMQADCVTAGHDDDGVARVLEKLEFYGGN